MAVTQNEYTGNGSATTYSFTFPYLQTTDVKVKLDGVTQATTAYTFPTATTVQMNSAPDSNVKVLIYRDTGNDNKKATFYPGSAIKAEDLNDDFDQILYTAQEIDNYAMTTLGDDTMIGNLQMGENQLVFEGATADAHETSIGVVDPTADRTINFPNVSGTVITTGDTGTVTSTILAANSVDSSELVDGSIDTSHIADLQVTTAKIAADAVTGAKIADDSIDSEHYVAGSIDHEHLAAGSVTGVKLQGDVITADKIADDAVQDEHLNANAVTTQAIYPEAVTTAKIADAAITTAKIAADAINATKIADDAVQDEHLNANAVTSQAIFPAAVTTAKIADDAVTTAKLADAELTTLAGMPTATASALADSTALDVSTTEINRVVKNKYVETSITNSDNAYPTSGAVIDYVAAQIAPLGGLEVIANEDSFPTQPASGVVISIADAGGIVVNGSGVSTTARTSGNGSDNVTINGFPSTLHSTTLADSMGLLVSSTGSSNTYTYHKLLGKEDDIKNLSDDINDFNARYRIASSAPSSNNDDGDLYFDTTSKKMKVYNASTSQWDDVASSSSSYIVTLSESFNGSLTDFTMSTAATDAQSTIVSINGVIQKPNAGTSTPTEGFAISGNTLKLSNAPATGSTYFIVVLGDTVSIGTPSDNTVSTAKIQNVAVTTGKIADDAVTADKLASNAVVNASVDASAAIAGSKINPDFGSQDITTTGNVATGQQIVITGNDPRLKFVDSNNNPDWEIWANAEQFSVYDDTNDKTRLYINSSGNLGIGTITPVASDSGYNGAAIHLHQTNSSSAGSQIHLTNGATGSAAGNGAFISMWSDDDVYFTNQESDGKIKFATGGNSDVLVLNDTGLVGIGGSPGWDLDVHGSNTTINIEATGWAQLRLTGGTTENYITSDDNLSFYIGGTEKVFFNTDGSVGIGTDNPRGSATYKGLELNGTTGGVITFSDDDVEKWNVYGQSGNFGIYDRVNTRYNLKCLDDGDVEISVGNVKVANGKGIDFSATADSTGSNISMDSELLDDYERGTWGSINSGASSCTFSHNWYVKVGRKVTCNIRCGGITTPTGDAFVLNLPFANGTVEASGSFACDTFNMPSDWVQMTSYAYDSKLYVLCSRDNAGWENLIGNQTANNSTLIMNITYLATA